jgi:undecaprenyl-diphosphatase
MQHTSPPAAPAVPAARVRPTFALLVVAIALGCVILALAGYTQPVVMGIVQGLGEFLPISSSAHLILIPWFFGWPDLGLTFDIALHLGTLVAVVIYFWQEWIALAAAAPGLFKWALRAARGDRSRKRTDQEHILTSILIATIPGAALGMVLEKLAEGQLRDPLLIAVTLSVMGVLLYAVDRWRPEHKPLEKISWRDSLLIGLAQACALVPGFSRSGTTIAMGRWLMFDRVAAARYSFLLSAPITAGAVLVTIDEILRIPVSELDLFLVGVLVSAAVGALAIRFLLASIRRIGFGGFAIYRVTLALVIVLVFLVRG